MHVAFGNEVAGAVNPSVLGYHLWDDSLILYEEPPRAPAGPSETLMLSWVSTKWVYGIKVAHLGILSRGMGTVLSKLR